jgi:hypothetical protein
MKKIMALILFIIPASLSAQTYQSPYVDDVIRDWSDEEGIIAELAMKYGTTECEYLVKVGILQPDDKKSIVDTPYDLCEGYFQEKIFGWEAEKNFDYEPKFDNHAPDKQCRILVNENIIKKEDIAACTKAYETRQ